MQPFAPTPYLPASIDHGRDLNEEIRLADTPRERDVYDTLSVIYSILVLLEFLEKAYVRDSLSLEEYQERCSKLLSQYTSGIATIVGTSDFTSLDEFCAKYRISYPLAVARVKEGKPAGLPIVPEVIVPTAPAVVPVPKGTSAVKVAETVQNFITLMDALKLSFRAKDQLHPLLSDLMTSITQHDTDTQDETPELEGKGRIVKWLIRINQMKVSEEISEEEARELFFEVEGLYAAYLKTL